VREATRAWTLSVCSALVLAGPGAHAAKYNYGHGTGETEQGIVVLVEGGLYNPRNTDAVVATAESIEDFGGGTNQLRPILPVWNEDVAGRVGLGYAWGEGQRVMATYWTFSSDQSASGDGPGLGRLHFAVGPPIFHGGQYVGDNATPGSYSLTTEVKAEVADVDWSRVYATSETLSLGWSIGLRYATYTETTQGFYDEASLLSPNFGQVSYSAFKTNQSTAFGARVAGRGSFGIGAGFSLDGEIGLSLLDNKIESLSRLAPIGTVNQPTTPIGRATAFDDGRSGTIFDVELTVAWSTSGNKFRLYSGWRQSVWDEITRDLVRNFPGTSAPLEDRSSVTFSGYVAGMMLRL
jgi:hypothetical protein